MSLTTSADTAALSALDEVRARTLAMIAHLGHHELERQVAPILSPLVWDLAHIAAYEDLWLCHRHGGRPLLRPALAETYDAFESPRAVRGSLPLLDVPEALRYLAEVRVETAAVLADVGPDATLVALVLGHELQHTETMLQTMAIAGRLPVAPAPRALAGQEHWVAVAAGPHALGAADDVAFAYDNEQPQHEVDLGAFRIAARPVSNASWLRFADGGGYTRREWWTREGWAWKEQSEIVGHHGASSADPAAAVWGISFFEAEAFARSVDARLPTEAEWEKAVVSGALQEVGSVWEWTSSFFMGYPGFVARPYREYSEVFFGDAHRVLRGGSWATDPRVGTPTFRNWDLPLRRQLFAGVRLARTEGVSGARRASAETTGAAPSARWA